MSKLNIVYWSGTGNTEEMANIIAEGAKSAGADVRVLDVVSASGEDLNEGIIGFGSPSMGAEEVAEEIDQFIVDNKDKIAGKKIGLFGSYDWGNGEWIEEWKDTLRAMGADVLDESCIVNLKPDAEAIERCKEYGKKLVS